MRDFTNQRVRKRQRDRSARTHGQWAKSRVRVRVEQVFAVVERLWGFDKVRLLRVRKKGATQAFAKTALANIFLARRQLVA